MGTPSRPERGLKVGKLAAATGLTVRTRHYYEEIGLLALAHAVVVDTACTRRRTWNGCT